MGFLPRRATGQLVFIVIVVMLAAQGITFWILADERQGALRSAGLDHLLQRVANAYVLVDETAPGDRDRVFLALSDPMLKLSAATTALVATDGDPRFSGWLRSEGPLADAGLPEDRVRTRILVDDDRCETDRHREKDRDRHHDDDTDDLINEYHEDWHKRLRKKGCPPLLEMSLQLTDGGWLNTEAVPPRPSWLWLKAALLAAGITAVLLVLAVVLAIRYILAPVRRLQSAAHAFSMGTPQTVPEQGPEDIRDVIRAFNFMQIQVGRAQDEKARLLAALAHDLRTPLTAMRLRVEMLPEGDDRNRLLENLREMQNLAEDTLSFIRGSATEAARKFDVSALLESLCDDLSEIGMPVTCGELPRCVLRGRPDALRRAIRNLLENAVNYGGQAEVALAPGPDGVLIRIADRGPGIAPELREKVFEPFWRAEGSRSRDSGGAGLGLAIARTLVLGMGGDIRISDRQDGPGAEISVWLPLSP